MSTCLGCGAPMAPNSAPGRPRKWCSETCRKGQYSTPCVDCGTPTTGSSGRGAHIRCVPCANAIVQGERHAINVATVEAMWADGLTLRQIAERMGWKSPKVAGVRIAAFRAEGADLPHRRSPELVSQLQKLGAQNLVKARAAKVAS